jgi:hypothetical protein
MLATVHQRSSFGRAKRATRQSLQHHSSIARYKRLGLRVWSIGKSNAPRLRFPAAGWWLVIRVDVTLCALPAERNHTRTRRLTVKMAWLEWQSAESRFSGLAVRLSLIWIIIVWLTRGLIAVLGRSGPFIGNGDAARACSRFPCTFHGG